MDVNHVDNNENPFRECERKYKKRKTTNNQTRSKEEIHINDFEDVIDFENLEGNTENNKKIIVEYSNFSRNGKLLSAFGIKDLEGFYFICNPFTLDEQWYWAETCLTQYLQPPHTNNLSNLDSSFQQSKEMKSWNEVANRPSDSYSQTIAWLKKIRWITLGYQYNWSLRSYDPNKYTTFPTDLFNLSKEFCNLLGRNSYDPQAAIVNFYQEDSSFMAHLDDVEESKEPIISFSFGQTAIFLIGGLSKNVRPHALFVRSGDVIIMSDYARNVYHGVPRILPNSTDLFAAEDLPPVRKVIAQYLKQARININVRQVFQSHEQ